MSTDAARGLDRGEARRSTRGASAAAADQGALVRAARGSASRRARRSLSGSGSRAADPATDPRALPGSPGTARRSPARFDDRRAGARDDAAPGRARLRLRWRRRAPYGVAEPSPRPGLQIEHQPSTGRTEGDGLLIRDRHRVSLRACPAPDRQPHFGVSRRQVLSNRPSASVRAKARGTPGASRLNRCVNYRPWPETTWNAMPRSGQERCSSPSRPAVISSALRSETPWVDSVTRCSSPAAARTIRSCPRRRWRRPFGLRCGCPRR